MRTTLFLLAGLLITAASFILGRLFLPTYPKAGYTVAEELRIFLVLFGIPTLIMLFLRWKFL